MPNQIPVINYILHIVDDACYWTNISVEHLIILNELLKEEEMTVDQKMVDSLNEIYGDMEQSIGKLDHLEKTALYGERYPEFVLKLCGDALRVLEEISDIRVQLIQLLSKLENLRLKNFYLLIVSHITLEERYSLEILSGHINKITGAGFPLEKLESWKVG